MKNFLSTITLLLVASCATPFSEPQYGYGVAATPLGGNVFRVQAQLNSWSSPNMVGDYLLLRAADVAGRNGAIGFVILDSRDTSTRSTYMAAPGQYSSSVVGCEAVSFTPCRVDTTYRPPVYYSDLYPGGMMTIRLVWQPESGWYDKNQVMATIGPRYGVAWTGTPTSGSADYARVRSAANQGDAQSQAALAFMYHSGQGVAQSHAEALRLYQLAANQGHADAQVNLGWMYYSGQGVAQNCAEALRLYQLAANQGNARAQNNLGWMYQHGECVTQDLTEAERLYRLAADNGDAMAQANLSRLTSAHTTR